MVNPKHMHTSNIIWTEQAEFINLKCEYLVEINGKRGHKCEREQGE